MRDPKRIDRILGLVRTAWTRNPDLRFGQLVYHVVMNEFKTNGVLFQLEDDRMEQALEKWNATVTGRESAGSKK